MKNVCLIAAEFVTQTQNARSRPRLQKNSLGIEHWSDPAPLLTLVTERPPAELIHEYGPRAVTERIRGADAPAVDARAVGTHTQAYEVFESRVIQHRERLHVFVAEQREQREVGA